MNKYRVHGVIVFRSNGAPTLTERRAVEIEAEDRRQAFIRGKAALEHEARQHTPFTHDDISATTTLLETLEET